MKKIVSVILVLILMILLYSAAFAETVSGRGYENASYTFYAEATGSNATIYFKQTKARAVLNYVNFLTDEWGCYHIYYTYNGVTYSTEWNDVRWNSNNETFELDLPYKGIYEIRVVAYSAEEINDLYAITHFTCWFIPVDGGTGPKWWVENCYNCRVSNSPFSKTGTVTVNCYDQNSNLIKRNTITLSASQNVAPPSISGYTAISDSQYVTVRTDTGTCSPSSVSFYYTPNNTVANPPIGEPVHYVPPYRWDTKFRPEYSTKNPDGYRNLDKLTDGSAGTVFGYYLYNSDKNNGLPDFTAYFDNGIVSGIKIRNGDGGNYYHYMRINYFHVVVNTSSGSYTERTMTIPDSPSGDYYSFGFSRSYSGVTSIEIYIDDRNVGEGEERNLVRIRDIAFY